MAKIDVSKTMGEAVPTKRKRTFGTAKPQPLAPEPATGVSAKELEDAKKANAELQNKISELEKSNSELIAKTEEYDGLYIPSDYKLKEIPIEDTVYFSRQAEVFGSNFFESAAAAPMISSIETSGLAQPILVRELPAEEGKPKYEIVIGHSRVEVYRFLQSQDKPGYSEKYSRIEAKVYEPGTLSDEAAEDLFFESNFAQRGKLPVKATAKCVAHFAKKMKKLHDPASKTPWYREFSEQFKMAQASIFEWQAVANLNDEFILLIEERKLKQKFATKLGKLSHEEQSKLWNECQELISNKNINAISIADGETAESVKAKLIEVATPASAYEMKISVTFTNEADYNAFLAWREIHKSVITSEK